MSTRETDVALTREQMVAIRDHVRSRLKHDYHSHLLIAKLYRKHGNPARAEIELADARTIHAMLTDLEPEPDTVQA